MPKLNHRQVRLAGYIADDDVQIPELILSATYAMADRVRPSVRRFYTTASRARLSALCLEVAYGHSIYKKNSVTLNDLEWCLI